LYECSESIKIETAENTFHSDNTVGFEIHFINFVGQYPILVGQNTGFVGNVEIASTFSATKLAE
jgi:hypothetical protein